MIKIYTKDIYPALVALSNLMEVPLNINASYKIARVVDALNKELKTLNEATSKTRDSVLEKYGVKGKDGKFATYIKGEGKDAKEYYKLTDEKAYEKELQEALVKLDDEEITLNDIDPIKTSQITTGKGDAVDLPAKSLVAISSIITE